MSDQTVERRRNPRLVREERLLMQVTGRSGKLLLSGEVRWSVEQDAGHLIGIQLHERDGFDLLAWKALFGG